MVHGAVAPGPRSLEALLTQLRVPDQGAACVALARQLVPGQTGPGDSVSAVVWGTPDADRSIADIAAPFSPAERDRLLEATVARLRFGHVYLLVEQPQLSTGIGAYVSRYGEGLAAIYVERPRFTPAASAHRRPPRPMRTPLRRRGWLLPHEWPWGPFVIVLEAPR